jgi:hypothetical protein
VVLHPRQRRPGAGADAGCLDPVGDQIAFGENERDLHVDVMDRAGDELTHGPHPGSPCRQPLVGQVADEVFTHELVDDPVGRVVLELALEPAYHLRAVHPPSRVIAQQVY